MKWNMHILYGTVLQVYYSVATFDKYIGKTWRWLGDQFQEHLWYVERNNKDASKPVARHCNLSNHSKQHMAVCGLFLYLGSWESCNLSNQHSWCSQYQRGLFIQLIYSCFLVTIFPSITELHCLHINTHKPTIPTITLTKGYHQNISF